MAASIRTPKAESKVVRAARIFSETVGFSRALVVSRFEKELDLTPSGASTYYQNCRRKAGLVTARKGSGPVTA